MLKLTKIRAVGVCHGFDMGVEQATKLLGCKPENIEVTGYGLNHFGWLTKAEIRDEADEMLKLITKLTHD